MSSLQLITRLITAETGLSQNKLRRGDLDKWEWEILHNKIKHIEKADIFIDDTPGISAFDLRAKCRRLINEHQVEIIIVDYLQLMTTKHKKGNREQEISMISRSLKGIAKELNIPVVALSQLSRAVESREVKRPMLSDLRESGAIEQDADIVSFIYRPEYYGVSDWDTSPAGPTDGEAEFIIAKHRNGPTHKARLKFLAKEIKFESIGDDIYNNQYDSKINSAEEN
jgi:replicative DNA helicase